MTQIEREFGQGSLMRLGDESAIQVEAIPTGALSLDLALGVGGVPRGRIVEIFGPESSGKTTLVYHIIAEAQALGGICAFVDTEHAIDPIYAKRIGVDVDELLVSQPDYGEQALEIVDVLVRSGAVDLVAIDSVAALTPRVELEGQMGETQVGLQARLMSQALRKLAGNLSRANTVCVFTNQIREKIGVSFGSPETQPGRPGAEVLLLAAPRHPPHRDPQGGHRGGRQPGPGEGGQEQGRGALPPGRVRHRVRDRDLERGLPARPRARARPGAEVRLVLLLRRAAARPGPQQHQAVPGREPGDRPRDRGEAGRCPRHRAQLRRRHGEPTPIADAARGGARSPSARPPSAGGRRVADPKQTPSRSRSRRCAARSEPPPSSTAWLERRGYGAEEIEAAIDRLTEVGELDDERFARRYAEDKRELRGWGAERIREALLSRGRRLCARRGGAGGGFPRRPGRPGRDLLARRGRPLAWTPIARGRSAT